MTGSTRPSGGRSVEELLTARLHEVDGVEPPASDLELRALREGRARVQRRQTWRRGLVGAAAAVVVGALAVPAISGLRQSVGTGSASSGGSAASAPESAASGPNLSAPGGQPGVDGSAPAPGGDRTLSLPLGQTAYDWTSADATTRFATLRQVLARPEYAGTPVTWRVDESVQPARLVVRLGAEAPQVITAVTSAFPPGAPIVVTVAGS